MKYEKRCSVDGCDGPYSAKGYCRIHYLRASRNGTAERPRCKVCGTTLRAGNESGYCHAHRYGHSESPKGPDLTGQKFGMLTVLRETQDDSGIWVCRCDCGSEREAKTYTLRKRLRSCGCLRGRHPKKKGAESPLYIGPVTEPCMVAGCANARKDRGNAYCWKHYYRLRRGALLVNEKEPNGFCNHCGQAVGPNKFFCSERCIARHRRKNPKTALCGRCGTEFVPYNGAKFCSVKCREDHIEERNAKYHRERWLNTPEYDQSDLWKSGNRKRLAILKAVTTEKFSRAEIFERDGWTCGICGHPIDKQLRWPNMLSASLDHIQALAAGGQHSRANVQASHLKCNITKGKYRDTAKIRRLQHKIAERIAAMAGVSATKADRLAERHALTQRRRSIG